MKRRLKEPFGKAGLTVAILALVLAMVGGAYAAGGLTKSQEKQVKKIAKKYAGKPGPVGAVGAAGAAGKQGPEGPAGATGKQGIQGKQGEEGLKGQEGSPWVDGGTLPKGSTETGTWNVQATDEAGGSGEEFATAISFPIPLSTAPKFAFIELEQGEGEPNENQAFTEGKCKGTVANPGAEPGNLCIFFGKTLLYKGGLASDGLVNPQGLGPVPGFGPGTTGAIANFGTTIPDAPGAEVTAEGTWAVTGG